MTTPTNMLPYRHINKNIGRGVSRTVVNSMLKNENPNDFKELKNNDGNMMIGFNIIRINEVIGYGMFAAHQIPADAPVGEYVGKIIKHKILADIPSRYLASTNLSKDEWTWSIDAEEYGNETRFINHSDDPNCKMWISKDRKKIRVYIYTIRTVEAGEELTTNYGYSP